MEDNTEFEVGDHVIVIGGRWITKSGEVLRVTRYYIRIELDCGIVAMVRKHHCEPLDYEDWLNIISDDGNGAAVSTATE